MACTITIDNKKYYLKVELVYYANQIEFFVFNQLDRVYLCLKNIQGFTVCEFQGPVPGYLQIFLESHETLMCEHDKTNVIYKIMSISLYECCVKFRINYQNCLYFILCTNGLTTVKSQLVVHHCMDCT